MRGSTNADVTFGAHGFEALVDVEVAGPPHSFMSKRILSLHWDVYLDSASGDAGITAAPASAAFALRAEVTGVSSGETKPFQQDTVPNLDLCEYPIERSPGYISQSLALECDDASACMRTVHIKITAVPAASSPPSGTFRLTFHGAQDGEGSSGGPKTTWVKWSAVKVTPLQAHPLDASSFCP